MSNDKYEFRTVVGIKYLANIKDPVLTEDDIAENIESFINFLRYLNSAEAIEIYDNWMKRVKNEV